MGDKPHPIAARIKANRHNVTLSGQPIDTSDRHTGLPRPFATPSGSHQPGKPPVRLPVPWMGWSEVCDWGQYGMWDFDAVAECEDANWQLCNICGDRLGQTKVFGLLDAVSPGKAVRSTGTGLHARCALISYHYCPHFRGLPADECFVVVESDGPGFSCDADPDDPVSIITVEDGFAPCTLAELKALARREASA